MKIKKYLGKLRRRIVILNTLFLLKRLSRKSKLVFAIPPCAGDTLFSCAFFKELERQENCNYKLVIYKKYKYIVEGFGIKNAHYYSSELGVSNFLYSKRAKEYIKDKIGTTFLIPYLWFFYEKEKYNKDMDVLTFIKKEVYKLKNDNPKIEYVKIKETKPKIDITKKYVILLPYSFSAYIPEDILKTIADKLKEKGYLCYSNVCKGQKEIPGTIRFDYSMNDLAIASRYANAIIGVRTGGMDYIVSYAKRIFAIYDNDIDKHVYNLDQWQTKCIIKEYLYNKRNETNSLITQVLNDFDK